MTLRRLLDDSIITVPAMQYEVDANWMRTCGKGFIPHVFDVIFMDPTVNGMTGIEIRDPETGRDWYVIAEWRGRFLP